MERYIDLLLQRRGLVLVVVGLLTAASLALVGSRAVIATSLNRLFLGEMDAYQQYLDRVRDFASDQVVIVAIRDLDPLHPASLDQLEAAAEALEAIEDVGRVESPLTAQRITWEGDALTVRPYAEEARKATTQAGRAALLDELVRDPLAAGVLVSADGRHGSLVVEIVPDDDRPAERGPEIGAEIHEALVGAGFDADQLHYVGFIAVLTQALEQSRFTIERLFPYVALVLLLVVWLLFRRTWPVGLALGVSGVGVAWTMGFSVLLDPHIGILHTIVPPVVLIVGFSDVIHLCSAYLIELDHGHEKDEAIRRAAVDVGRACVYTSATTFVGFIGLSFVPTPAFRHLGIVLGFGVGTALLVAMTVVPVVFSFMRRPKPWRMGATSRLQGLLDRLLARLATLTTRRPWTVIGGFVVAAIAIVVGLAHLEIETRFTARFDPESKVRQDADFFATHFARANFVDVFVDTGEREGLFDPETFARLASLQADVAALDGVDRATSLVDLVREIHEALTADMDDPPPLPTSREALAQYMLLFEMSGGSGIRRLVDFDRRTALMSVRIADEGVRAAHALGERIEGLGRRHLGDAATTEPSGIVYLLGIWLGEIVVGQAEGLGFTFVIIALMMMWGLRSVRVGLWSMVPNVLPVLALGGYLGLAYDAVDSDTMVLGMLAIGIGVDDTIHFLMRFRIESERTEEPAEAIRRTYDFAGRAIVMTTMTLGFGFAPFALSDYYSSQIFGTLLPMTLVVALLADLLLVPALARVGFFGARRAPRPSA